MAFKLVSGLLSTIGNLTGTAGTAAAVGSIDNLDLAPNVLDDNSGDLAKKIRDYEKKHP